MKKQTDAAIKARLIPSAFYLLLLTAVYAMPFAQAPRNNAGCPAYTGDGAPTATASPTCTPGGSPGPWTMVAFYPGLYFVSVSSDGTSAYAAGGYTPTNLFSRYDPGTNTWTRLPDVPIAFFGGPSVYVPTTNSVYVFGGMDSSYTAIATTQIYNITTGTWTVGADMPRPRYLASAAYYGGNNKVYVIGGLEDFVNQTDTTWEYDPVDNTWNTSRARIPVPMGGSGYSIVGQNIYLAGSDNDGNGSTLHYRYDIVADSWTAVAPVPVPITGAASAAVGTQEFLIGGGNPEFAGSSRNQRLRPVSKTASTRSPVTSYTSTYIYDTVTDSWSSGPDTNVPHSLTGGTAIGNLLLVVSGFDGVLPTPVVESSLVAGPCASPSPTPSATPTSTFTPTPTATATASPTATASATPRSAPTARPRPTPAPRP